MSKRSETGYEQWLDSAVLDEAFVPTTSGLNEETRRLARLEAPRRTPWRVRRYYNGRFREHLLLTFIAVVLTTSTMIVVTVMLVS